MNILDLFSGTQHLAKEFLKKGHEVVTVDIKQCRETPKLTHHCNIFDFNHEAYHAGHFAFIYVGLPCTVFSKASGGHHFISNIIPRTSQAHISILMIGKIYEILKYFKFPHFMLENPTGGLRNNFFFNEHCYFSKINIYTTALGCFGFPTQKKTDIFTNINYLILFPTSYRANGRYQTKHLDRMTEKQKSTYPPAFCQFIVHTMEIIFAYELSRSHVHQSSVLGHLEQ
jgi:site-specific DNA-cytosine methylase